MQTTGDKIEIEKKILYWFSGLPIESCKRIQDKISKFLKSFKGLKRGSGRVCHFVSCSKRTYSRGLCGNHYQFINRIRKETGSGWGTFEKMGLCKITYNQPSD